MKKVQGVLLPLALVMISAAALYLHSLSYGFVWDDRPMVAENDQLREPSFLLRAFAGDYWEVGADPQPSGYYRPLSAVSYQLTGLLFGFSPWPHRLVSILLHLANGFLLWRLLSPLAGGAALWLVAAFLVHPLAAEVPLFVSARPDAWLLFFSLLACACADRYRRQRERKSLALAAAAAAAAALSKEPGFVLFLLVPFFAWSCAQIEGAEKRSRQRIWFLAGTLAVALAAVFFWRAAVVGAFPRRDYFAGSAAATALTMPRVVMQYLGMALLPLWPAAIYDFPLSRSAADPKFLASVAALLALALGAIRLARRSPLARLGAGWFALGLFPYLNLLPSGVLLANRYLYLALPGLLLVVLAGWQTLAGHGRVVAAARALKAAGWVWVFCLLLRTAFWAPAWKSDAALWSQALRHNPHSPVAMNNLGNVRLAEGQLQEAAELYRQAQAEAPDYSEAQLNEARVLYRQGRLEEGIRLAERIPSTSAQAPAAADLLGSFYEARGDLESSEFWSRRAAAMAPAQLPFTFNLATTLLRRGRNGEAEILLREVLRRAPTHAAALTNLAACQVQRGAYEEALATYEAIERLAPPRPQLYLDRAVVLLRLRRRQEAETAWRRSGKLIPWLELARRAGVVEDEDFRNP